MIFPLKFQIQGKFPFNFNSLQKCSTNDLETITSCHYIQHITLHKNSVCLVVTNLKYKDYSNFYQFLLLLSGDTNLNPGRVQISPVMNINICEPLNKKGLHFLYISINSLFPKSDELKYVANKTKANIIAITESKRDHNVPELEDNLNDILQCDRNRNGSGVAIYMRKEFMSSEL